ncbi:MAG: HAD-IG family 5'-nucleotidase [Rhodothermales bacterium]
MSPSDRVRGIYTNRTLNLRSIKAIGYDMDYTLIHYHARAWEERAYGYIKERLLARGWPVEELTFQPDLVMRGLIIDKALGNVVKANRFGYIKKAFHGTEPLEHHAMREVYTRTLVDLAEPRWLFMNTLFSLSEASMYMQLVDLLDADVIEAKLSYSELYELIRGALDEAHMEGRLKGEIIEDPARFVALDKETPLTLLDQKESGKKILLITNSEWAFAAPMLAYSFDPFLPDGMTWRDLFDLAIVGSRKPAFFTQRMPAFEIVSDDGLLREHYGPLKPGRVYVGGNAALVEASLGLKGEDLLYVGDHLFTDVNISKSVLRWRTALILRELEEELDALESFEATQERLAAMMEKKVQMEAEYSAYRLALQRTRNGYTAEARSAAEIEADMAKHRAKLLALDEEIGPLARASATLHNPNWGLMMRTGNDKSHLARQVERYADVYTGRVSNFLHATPYAYLRSHRGSLPHDEA